MDSKTSQHLTLALLAIGTAASVYWVWKSSKPAANTQMGGMRAASVGVVRNTQLNRDANLGRAGRSRKYFGFVGKSSAQGFGAAASPPPAIGNFRSRSVIKPRIKAVISTLNRPTRNGYANTQTRPRAISSALPPY